MRTPAKLLSALAFFGGLAVLRADSGITAAPDLSLVEIKSRAATIEAKNQDNARRVIALKALAKKQQDVIKLTCVNDKLVQMKAQMNIADSINEQLQGALEKQDLEAQNLFAQLSQTGAAIEQLREEAGACVGEPELYKQESGNTYTHPEIVDDPTGDNPFGGELEPPGYASPYH